MKWHRDQENPTAKRANRRGLTATPRKRAVQGDFKTTLLHVLSEFPHGAAVKDVAVAMKKAGYGKTTKLEQIAAYVSSSAKFAEVTRVGRGVIKLTAKARNSLTNVGESLPSVSPVPSVAPEPQQEIELPKEALHLRIQQLENERDRFKRACVALMSGD
jgi:hypothetical protein